MGTPHASRARGWMAALAWTAGAAAAQDKPMTAEELYERIAPSVWMVQVRHANGSGIGSAVVVAPGTLITNCHVVDKAVAIAVRHGQRRHVAQLQHRDPSRDLCQLSAPVDAPAVAVVDWRTLRIGTKLYALGNPRGLELTLSDGLLSGIRRDLQGSIEAIQISVPISPGSSGGGLFDVHGRLVGITTSGLKESQNLNFALPATWIAELPARAGVTTASTIPAAPAPAPAPAGGTPGTGQPAVPQEPGAVVANVFEYELRDRLTGLARRVVYRVDKRENGLVVINGGSRVEDAAGRVVALKMPIAGEFELAMPPAGWMHGEDAAMGDWSSTYLGAGDGRPYRMEVRAQRRGEEQVLVAGHPVRALRVEIDGYTTRGGGSANNPPGRYRAVAWYATELGRIVRFEARSRGGLGHTAFVVDEVLELVEIRTE